MKTKPISWQDFKEHHIDKILIVVVLLLVALAVAVMVSECVACYLQQLLGLKEKYKVLQTIGVCITGVLLALQAVAANKRAKDININVGKQADATKNTETGQRQERLKNATEQLGNERDSVRMGGAHGLFRLAKETEDLRETALDILCAHVRQMTGENDYQEKHKTEPSEEIQSLLKLLFIDEHDVFEDYSIDLQSSYLKGANLSKARLQGANLREAQLQGADLSEAQLQMVVFRHAKLEKAKLWKAQLQEADLMGAQLQKADLRYARLQGADLSQTQLQEVKLIEAQLQMVVFRGAKLEKAKLWKAQLQGANLKEAKLQGANLSRAQLQGADLSKAQLQEANLREAQLQRAHLSKTLLQRANIRYVQLQGANLREAQLQGADLYKAQLQGVNNQEKYPPGFESNIRNQTGKSSDLTGIIFAGGLQEKDLDTLCKGLSAEKAQALRKELTPHVGQPASHELPENSDAVTGAYTQEEAKQWIAEYNKAMEEVPKRDDG